MASQQPNQNEDLRFRVMRELEREPHLSQRELAQRLGVSNGKLNYCLRALIDKGLVKLANFASSQHRLGYAYLLTPAGIRAKASLTGRFLQRKMAEFEMLKAEIEALASEAGNDKGAERGAANAGDADSAPNPSHRGTSSAR